jgi:hypothetical protein
MAIILKKRCFFSLEKYIRILAYLIMKSKYLFHYGMFFDINLTRYPVRSSPSQEETVKANPVKRMCLKLI